MKLRATLIAAMMALFVVTGCTPAENWDDPKWIAHAIKHNHPKAFGGYMKLDEADRKELLPDVIEAYHANQQQREALRAMLSVRDARTVEVYENALARADDRLALLGARGLIREEVNNADIEIAERLKSVTTEDTFLGFIEALENAKISTETADIIGNVNQRPVDKIGGVDTVKAACRMLRQSPKATEDVIKGILIGLVNFSVQSSDDPVHDCEMAALAHRDHVVDGLVELFNGENERANEVAKAQGFSDASVRMRGALVLGHLRNHEANNAIRTWLKTKHTVSRSKLGSMKLEEQQAWYDNHGQLFEIAVKALSYERNAKDADLLRSLLNPDGELKNFKAWFTLSEGAEMGLRQAAATALVGVSQDKKTRDVLWNDARSGKIARGGEQTNTLYHLNVLHALGRIAVKGDLKNFTTAFNAQPDRWKHEFRSLYGYFLLGEVCDTDIECRKKYVLDPAELLERDDVQKWIDGEDDDDRRDKLSKGIRQAIQAGGVWQIAILGGDANASRHLVDILQNGPEVAQTAVPEALLYCSDWSDTISEDLKSWIDANKKGSRISGWTNLRSLLEVIAELSET